MDLAFRSLLRSPNGPWTRQSSLYPSHYQLCGKCHASGVPPRAPFPLLFDGLTGAAGVATDAAEALAGVTTLPPSPSQRFSSRAPRFEASRCACAHRQAKTLPIANNAPNRPSLGRAIVIPPCVAAISGYKRL